MALRSRSETSHVVVSAPAGTTGVVPASGASYTGIYKIIVTCSATATLQIQDTASNVLSQTFSFGANGGSLALDIPINGEPWWQAVAAGIQFVVTGATISADVWYKQGI